MSLGAQMCENSAAFLRIITGASFIPVAASATYSSAEMGPGAVDGAPATLDAVDSVWTFVANIVVSCIYAHSLLCYNFSSSCQARSSACTRVPRRRLPVWEEADAQGLGKAPPLSRFVRSFDPHPCGLERSQHLDRRVG